MLKTKNIDIIIYEPTYILTEIDVCIISWFIKVPIIFYFQSKNNVKCFRFDNQKEEKKNFFFIRMSRGKFNLNKIGRNPYIHIDALKNNMKEDIIKGTLYSFEDYLTIK